MPKSVFCATYQFLIVFRQALPRLLVTVFLSKQERIVADTLLLVDLHLFYAFNLLALPNLMTSTKRQMQ